MDPELYANIWGSLWLTLAAATLIFAILFAVVYWAINRAYSCNGGETWRGQLDRSELHSLKAQPRQNVDKPVMIGHVFSATEGFGKAKNTTIR